MGLPASRVIVVTAAIAACGRVGFDGRAPVAAAPDGPLDAPADTATATPRLVTMTSQVGSAHSLQFAIPPVAPGDLLLVAIVTWDGTPVTSVAADGPLTSAGVRATNGISSELWYGTPAGATNVGVEMGGSASGFDVWAAEFGGIAPGPPAATGSGCLEYPPDVVAAPVTALPGELVFGVTMLAYPAYASAVAAPFTALPVSDGNGAAYYVAMAPGSYGPSWSVGSGSGMQAMTCASTAAFMPAP